MLAQRLVVAIIIIPVLVILAYFGGWTLAIAMTVFMGIAAWEYWRLFCAGGYHPPLLLLIAGAVGIVITRHAFPEAVEPFISLFLMAALAWQVVRYEKGSQTAAADFGITVGGMLYLGWLGSYFAALRALPEGIWWFLTVLPAINISDAGAYFIGRRFGRHKISQRVSPKKSWEGYLGGIVIGTLGTMALASLWHLRSPLITAETGLILGLSVSILAPLGDLAESMLKRSFNFKDASNILPGHGGIMDRFDSWLWAAPIGYYIILTFFL